MLASAALSRGSAHALAPPAATASFCLRCRPPLFATYRRQRSSARFAPRATLTGPTGSGDEPLSEQPLASSSPILEVERQSERALAYAGITALLGGAGLALAVVPAAAVEFVWAACPSPFVAGMARITGALLLLAAVCANCLREAAEHDRLQSETYQRLNLGLVWWGLGTSLALWLAPQQPIRTALGLSTLLLCATAAHAAMTYQETSERGLNPLYLIKRFLSSLGNLSRYDNTDTSAIYSLYAYGLSAKATVAAAVAILLEGTLRLAQEDLLLVPLGTLGHALATVTGVGYLLLALVLFTLKDAAQRGRLGASTFRELNIGVAVVGITCALNVAAAMQVGYIVPGKLATSKVAAMTAMAALALYNYFMAPK